MTGGLFRISHTRVRAFDQCRKKYWFEYVSAEPRPERVPSVDGIVGMGVHRALKTLCDTGDPADGHAELDVYLRMPIHAEAGPGTDQHRVAFDLFERGCAAHASIESEDRWSELSTWVHRPREGVQIDTKIDRADRLTPGHWQIIDWKTTRRDYDDVSDAQLDIGHLAVRTTHNLPRDARVTAIAWNLRTGRQRVRELVRDDARATVDRLVNLAHSMEATTEFPATPSPLCTFCDWRPVCPDAARAEAGDHDWLE